MEYARAGTARRFTALPYRETLILVSWVLARAAGGLPVASAQQPAAAPSLAFQNLTVVDVTDGRRVPDQTVVVVGNRIAAVGQAGTVRVPDGAKVIDARGKYLIPGLWDMHAHTEAAASDDEPSESEVDDAQNSFHDWLYPLYIANGITGIREMAQRWTHGTDSFRVWQQAISAGRRVGPRLIGPSADLYYLYGSGKLETQDARRLIDSLKAAGDIFVKFHDDNMKDRDFFFTLLREARRAGMPVVGHVPKAVTNVEAADSGMLTIEHNNEHRQCWPAPNALPDSATLERLCAPVAEAYIRNGTWLVPTMAIHRTDADPFTGRSTESWNNTLRFWRMMRRLGVKKFLAGTDWMEPIRQHKAPQFWPGLSGREELVFLVDAGFTPLEALQAGTLNPAEFLHATDSLGTVAPGKLADLVLLDADPVADIANVLKLWGVVANGRYFDRATLTKMDAESPGPEGGLVTFYRQVAQEEAKDAAQAEATAP